MALILVGHVKTFLDGLFTGKSKSKYTAFEAKIKQVADDPHDDGEGRLKYNGLIFLEWKVGTTNRFFGFRHGENFYVCLVSTEHKKGKYSEGMTYDGNDEFDADYQRKQLSAKQLGDSAEKSFEATKGHLDV